jgi:anti-sigma factor RsiW
MSSVVRIDDVMLMAYVDGEVDAATAREIESAMAEDPTVAARVHQFRATAALARGAFAGVLHEPVPERLVAVLQAAPVAAPAAETAPTANVVPLKPRARPPIWRGVGWAAAAAVFGVAVLAGGARTGYVRFGFPTTSQQLAAADNEGWLDNVAAFYREYDGTLQSEQRLLVDFGAEHMGELEKWFSTKLNRQITVPDLAPFGFQPQGGRLLIIRGRPAAQFLYEGENHQLIGLVVAMTDQPNRGGRLDTRGDVNLVHWRENGYTYAFVGKIDGQKLWRMADLTWSALKPI